MESKNQNLWPPQKPDKFLEYQTQCYEKCVTMELYSVSERINPEAIDTTILASMLLDDKTLNNQTQLQMSREEKYVTVEYQAEDKATIYNGKYSTCSHYIQNMKLYQTLVVDLTSRDEVLKPFWTQQSREISNKLWLPIKTDCVVSDTNFSKTSSNDTVMGNSWFSSKTHYPLNQNLLTTYFKYSPSLRPEYTGLENIVKKSKKIRIFPDEKQTKILKQWFGISRWYYNRTIDYIKNVGKFENFYTIRNNMRNKVTRNYDIPDWCTSDVSPRIITGAIKDCCDAHKSSFALKKKKIITHFNIAYRTKKNGDQSLNVEKICFGKDNPESMFKKYMKTPIRGVFKRGRKITRLKNMRICHDCRLVSEDNGRRFYINVMFDSVGEKQANSDIIALDPGLRTFQTGYSPSNICTEFGTDTCKTLLKYTSVQDSLRSCMSKTRCMRRIDAYRRKFAKMSKKIKYLVDDLHWKTIRHLITNYGLILLPEFNVSNMIRKHKLRREVKRLLCLQRHYIFKERLKVKCNEVGCSLAIVSESYTSKTCSNCGFLHPNLGVSKVYNCVNCRVSIDRDINGARNVFIKNYDLLKDIMAVAPVPPKETCQNGC